LTDFLIGTGGWAYFNVAGIDSLIAYSRAFNFVEVNSTFYKIPTIKTVESWRRIVPKDFQFSVRCNKRLTHELNFESVPETFAILDKMISICETLEAKVLHFQTPPSFNYDEKNIETVKDFFSSIRQNKLRIALEIRGKTPFKSRLFNTLQELDIIHCVDLLKGIEPAYFNNIIYTRLFGKGSHNIYQPLDNELKEIIEVFSQKGIKKAQIITHSMKMFKDAARLKIYNETGKFPMVTKSTGVDSLTEVLREDAKFPSSKTDLVNHQGWKIIDLTSTKRVRASDLLEKLPEKTYNGIVEIVQTLGDHNYG